jgi:hypothetical protein
VAEDFSNFSLEDGVGGDIRDFMAVAKDPFADYEPKPPIKIGEYPDPNDKRKKIDLMVSPTYLVVYKGKLPKDPAMQGKRVDHHESIRSRFTNKNETVSFDRSLGKVENRVAIVKDSSVRAQLLFMRDPASDEILDRDDFVLVDGDQRRLLALEFAYSSPAESKLVKQILGE